jgi:hypothetical protein
MPQARTTQFNGIKGTSRELPGWKANRLRAAGTAPLVEDIISCGGDIFSSGDFGGGPDSHAAVLVDLDMDDVGPAADGAVFDKLLARALGVIQQQFDFFSTRLTGVCCYVSQHLRTLYS